MPHIGEKAQVSTTAPVSMAAEAVAVAASPFTYTAARNGTLLMSGGTVSLTQYGRNSTMYALGILAGPITMVAGDQVRVTYLTAPSLTFLPSQ